MLQKKELTAVLINVIMSKMVLTFPKILIESSGSAAWLQVIYNTAAAFAIYLLISSIYKGKSNIIELAGRVGKKPLKIFVGMIVFAIFLINFSSIIRVFPETIKTILLQNFDTNVITVIFMVTIAVGSYMGIEAIARVNYIFTPFIFGILMLFLLFLIPYYNIYNILPIFGNGAKQIFLGGFNTISMYADLLLLNILLPYYKNEKEARKSGRMVFLITGPFMVLIIAAYCLVYPYPVSGEFVIPVYQLAQIIHLGNFFSRFEVLFQFAWSILLFLYSAIYVFALCYVWQTTFELKFYRPLVFPIVILCGVLSLLPATLSDIINNEKWEIIMVYPPTILLPLIFSFVSRKYYRKGEKQVNETC